jgi:methyl-accepting chemotaxis protein
MNWFRNLNTLAKLMLAFSLIAAAMAFVGYEGIAGSSTIKTMLDTLYERDMLGLSAMKQANNYVVAIGRDARAAIICTDRAQVEQKTRGIDDDFTALHGELQKVERTLTTDESKAKMASMKDLLPGYEEGVKEVSRQVLAGNIEGALATLAKVQPIGDQLDQDFSQMSEVAERQGKEAYDQSDAVYARLRKSLATVLCFSVLISIGLGYFISQLISRPLHATVGVLEKVAAGDLTVQLEVETLDEVGQMAASLNCAIEAMRTALSEVRASAESMASSAQQLASSSEELSSGAQQQASSLEETTSTLEEITSTVKQNADNAKQANQVASGSRDAAEKGGQVVTEAVTAMGEINESSKNIAEIITTIDEIAFQTNLLALNAAVEAARAGEQGRGFAVVATEVRNLAQRSATSAKEIKRLIQDSVRKVENGSALVNRSGETLHEIVGSVKRVTDIVAEIAAASREQSVGIEQVNKAMLQMDQVTQTNSSQTDELSSTAQSLSTHAQQLQGLVERFRLDEGGSRQQHAAPEPVAAPSPKVRRTVSPASAKLRAHRPDFQTGKTFPPPKVKPNGHDTSANAFEEF